MQGRLWYIAGYVAAGVIAFAGIVVADRHLRPGLAAVDAGTIRVVVPGTAQLDLDGPGHYLIFHEFRGVVDGRVYESRSVDGLRVTLEVEGNSALVPLVPPTMESEYEIGNRAGRSWLAFDVDRPGRFRLIASRANGAAEPKLVLAISRGLIGGIFGSIFVSLGIAAAGLVIAAVLLFIVNRARSKATSKA